jgi:hypothetical protein
MQGIIAFMLLETEGKFKLKMLTLPSRLLSIGQWQNTWEVTNSTEKFQDPNLCHDSCKNIYKKIASWCCGIILQNNDTSLKLLCSILCCDFIQIMSMTRGTSLLEQSSLPFHCHICCFVQEKINSSLKSGNACYHSVQNLLLSSLMSRDFKGLSLCGFRNNVVFNV